MAKRGSHEDFDIFQDPSVTSRSASHAEISHCDLPIKSIEQTFSSPASRGAITPPRSDEDEPTFEDDDGLEGPDFEDEISEFPDEVLVQSTSTSPYQPMRQRPVFRNPSSVKAIQLEHTPPPPANHFAMSPRYRLDTPSRHSSPRSVRSQQRDGSKTKSPSKKKEYPLVLLHITLLPLNLPLPLETLQELLPAHLIENYQMLRDKIASTTLDRGILIPHPREDYELLEERLLESLDLKTPRILKCGHFHSSLDDEAAHSKKDVHNKCEDCDRHVRDGPQDLAGKGCQRWKVRIFAANGLMRAGAWSAVWKEMERVDVEITPWLDEPLRKAVQARFDDEEARKQHAEVEKQNEERRRVLSEERLREIYGSATPISSESKSEQHDRSPDVEGEVKVHQPVMLQQRQMAEVPLQMLLKNYAILLLQDGRNVAIGVLAVMLMVLLTALSSSGGHQAAAAVPAMTTSSVAVPIVSTATVTVVQSAEPAVLMISTTQLASDSVSVASLLPTTAAVVEELEEVEGVITEVKVTDEMEL